MSMTSPGVPGFHRPLRGPARDAKPLHPRIAFGEHIKDTTTVIGKTFENLGVTVGNEAQKFGINVGNRFVYVGNQIGAGIKDVGNFFKSLKFWENPSRNWVPCLGNTLTATARPRTHANRREATRATTRFFPGRP